MKYSFAQRVSVAIFCCTPIVAFSVTYYDCINKDGSISYRVEPCLADQKEKRHFQVNLGKSDPSKDEADGHASPNPENFNHKGNNQNITVSTAHASPLSNVNTSPITEQDRKAKIEKVASWYSNMAQDQGTKLLEAATSIAMQFTLQLGSGANGWGPTNQNWKRVYDQVRSDTQSEMERFRTGRGHEFESLAEASFADALSMEDVNALTEFAKSKEGKRYWQLSTEVAKLFVDTVSHASTGNLTQSKIPPTQEEIKSWGRILKASNGARMMLAMIESNKRAGRDTSGAAGIGILWGMVFSAHQDEFRRLTTTYGNDLATFDMFNESPLGKRQIDALVTSSIGMMPKTAEILLEFRNQINTHQDSWKRLYASAVSENAPRNDP